MLRLNRKFILSLFILLFIVGCAGMNAPENFTPEQKVQFTTLKTLQAAKTFRVFALGAAGDAYKAGLITDVDKDKIIVIGDNLQEAINMAADALIAYKLSGDEITLYGKVAIYQKLFNQFMEVVTPYLGRL